MAQEADLPSASQLAYDLGGVARNGLGRPLYGKMTAADIPFLAAVAEELVVDATLPVERQIIDVVLPAVRRLYGQNQAAVCSLLWIDDVNSPAELVAQEGKRIPLRGEGGRHELAAFALGVSVSDFEKRKRRALLEQVAAQVLLLLETHRTEIDTPQGISEASRSFFDGEEAPFPYLQSLAWKAIELHYNALVALFVHDFSDGLPREDNFGRENLYPNAYVVWDTCSERIFRNYIECVATYRWYLNAPDEADALSDSGREKLKALYERCFTRGPARIHELDEESLGGLFSIAMDYTSFERSPLYAEDWRCWYADELEYPDPEGHRFLREPDNEKSQPHNLEIIAAASARMYETVSAGIDVMVPFKTMARNLAYKHIASCYIFDEWTPLPPKANLTLTLREHVALFIDRRQAELDKLIVV